MNCVPHYDPGLLSISFLSTHEGLQLKDPATDSWFAGTKVEGKVRREKGVKGERRGGVWEGDPN